MLQALTSILGQHLVGDLIPIVVSYIRFEGIEVELLQGHTSTIGSLTALPDARLVSGSHDKTIRIWDLNMGKAHICGPREEGDLTTRTCRYLTAHSLVTSLAVLLDGRLACGLYDGTIQVWDVNTGTSQVLYKHTDSILSLAVLPDGRLVSGSYDSTIHVWDLDTQMCQILGNHAGMVTSLLTLPDGHLVSAGGSWNITILIWDMVTGISQVLEKYTGSVVNLAVLPDGRFVCGSYDNTIRIWDLNMDKAHICGTREEGDLNTRTSQLLKGNAGPIGSLAVLPDGRFVLGSWDGSIRIWDMVAGITQVLEGHVCGITALFTLPDGRLVSGSHDKTIRIWA